MYYVRLMPTREVDLGGVQPPIYDMLNTYMLLSSELLGMRSSKPV